MSSSAILTLVLDTNIVLDWLVFNDPAMAALRDGVQSGSIVLLTHQAAMDELRRVLNYPTLKLDTAKQAGILARYQSQVLSATLPEHFSAHHLLLPSDFPQCRDPDDQPFLALAFHAQADALVSRDRAVLALRKRAKKFGLEIIDVTQIALLLNGLDTQH